jgi:2-polyprenyl-3-methyl-5-hydroxy-6-metoxy-1,4-benzoquinol methylase
MNAVAAARVIAEFRVNYRLAVEEVLALIKPNAQSVIARHNPGWAPGNSDLAAYLWASERRYVAALALHLRTIGAAGAPASVLDVGGFLGAFPLALARLDVRVTLSERYDYYYGAFDPIRDLLINAGVTVWDADFSQPLHEPPPEDYALVTNMAMLEHIAHSPKPLMDNLRNCVAPGGQLILEVPNVAYWPTRLRALGGGSVLPPLADVYGAKEPFTGHHREYTAAELEDLLAWSGFRLRELVTHNYTTPGRRTRFDLPRRRLRGARELLLAAAEPVGVGEPPLALGTVRLSSENVYGAQTRVEWLAARLRPKDRVADVGCGTGYGVTLPLLARGFDVRGVDLDDASVRYGQGLLRRAGCDSSLLDVGDVRGVIGDFDAVIVCDVLEHMCASEQVEALARVRSALRPGGRLLVTVSGGYSWLVLDEALMNRTPLGRLLTFGPLAIVVHALRKSRYGTHGDSEHPGTLASSRRRRRFTWRSIHRTLQAAGFDVIDARGSVLACGPLTHLAFTGSNRFMSINERLGRRLPRLASGHWLAAVRRD